MVDMVDIVDMVDMVDILGIVDMLTFFPCYLTFYNKKYIPRSPLVKLPLQFCRWPGQRVEVSVPLLQERGR